MSVQWSRFGRVAASLGAALLVASSFGCTEDEAAESGPGGDNRADVQSTRGGEDGGDGIGGADTTDGAREDVGPAGNGGTDAESTERDASSGGGDSSRSPKRDVGSTNNSSDAGKSADSGSGQPQVVRMIAMGDTGEGDKDQKRVAAAAQKRCDRAGGCHGFIMLGDNIYDEGPSSPQDMQFSTKVDKPYRQLKYGAPPAQGKPENRKRMPIYVSLGNHDLGGAGLESSLIQHYLDYAKTRSWFYYPKEYWEKQVGNVHLISIHTNPLAYKGTKKKPQGQLVQKALQKTSADWTIVFGHHPYRSNGQHGNAGEYEGIPGDLTPLGGEYRKWVNKYVCDKVDFLLTGHDHNRQWIKEMDELTGDVLGGGSSDACETKMAVSGAGAKTRGMKDRGNDLAFGKGTLGFLLLEFHKRKVEVEYVDDKGKTEWSKTVTK